MTPASHGGGGGVPPGSAATQRAGQAIPAPSVSRWQGDPEQAPAPRAGLASVLETPEELQRLQDLLDASMAGAGPHLRDIVTDERRMDAAEVASRLAGMRLLVLATVTADGRPLAGPVDGYFLHGTFWFSSGRQSVRMRHLAARPAVSATHLPGDELAVTVHGRAELFDFADPNLAELRQAMIDEYVPKQGPSAKNGSRTLDALGARIEPEKMFTFRLEV